MKEALIEYVMERADKCYADDFPIYKIEEWIEEFFSQPPHKTIPQDLIYECVQKIQRDHEKIIEDWSNAYMAEIYEKNKSIRPGDFILNQQQMNGKYVGFKYWFTHKDREEF